MQNNNSLIDDATPLEFYLSQNYRNPFKEKTTIKYCVAYKSKVQLEVFDEESKLIEKLVDEVREAGTYKEEFHSVTEARKLIPGIYLYRLVAGYYSDEKTMVFEK